MKCPHCLDSFFQEWTWYGAEEDADGFWHIRYCRCASCKRIIFVLERNPAFRGPMKHLIADSGDIIRLVYPKSIARAPLSAEVPQKFATDYAEACLVLADSTKASAALSRRCLQNLLREKAKVKPSNLADEIEQVMKSLPSHLSQAIDAVRNIGNFAAHPIKSTNTGEIIEVEPGEAEWLLDVLEGLFDFYFVQPATLEKKKQALNAKLKDAGKPEMK